MIRTRSAASWLAAAGLVAGLGATSAPALADDGHAVTVNVASAVPGWSVTLQCTPAGGGTAFQRQTPAASQLLNQRAVFSNVANATCSVQATSSTLAALGLPSSASASGVKVTKNVTVSLKPGLLPVGPLPKAGAPTPPGPPGAVTPPPAAAPQVAGKPVVGGTITAAPAAAPAGATITGYQWYINRVVHGHERMVLIRIKGAHHKSLRMKERLAGKHVLVGVTYQLAGAKPTTVYSKALKVMKERMKE